MPGCILHAFSMSIDGLYNTKSVICAQVCRQPAPEVNQDEERERLTVQLVLAEAKLKDREIDSAEQRAKVEELAAIVLHQVRGPPATVPLSCSWICKIE